MLTGILEEVLVKEKLFRIETTKFKDSNAVTFLLLAMHCALGSVRKLKTKAKEEVQGARFYIALAGEYFLLNM